MGRTDGGELRRADHRAMLMERMAETVAEAHPTAPGTTLDRELQAAFRRCFLCTQAGTCQRWLDGLEPDKRYREFCPNATLFERLGRG